MNRAIIEKELTQGVVPIGTPKAYQYDQALVESAVATVQQGLTDITVKTETEKTELNDYTETKKTEISTLGQGYVDSASQKVDEANTILTAIRNEYGYPFVASTVADMTDPAKIYVYTGSETGYVNGDWYYYDGTEWVDGGVYNAIAFNTDTTLTVSGAAADAKVTGDRVEELRVATLTQNTVAWAQGKLHATGGNTLNDATRIRSDYINASVYKLVTAKAGYEFGVWAYANNTSYTSFVGKLDSDGTFKKSETDYWVQSFSPIKYESSGYYFRYVLRDKTDPTANIVPADGVNCIMWTNVLEKEVQGVYQTPAYAGGGNSISWVQTNNNMSLTFPSDSEYILFEGYPSTSGYVISIADILTAATTAGYTVDDRTISGSNYAIIYNIPTKTVSVIAGATYTKNIDEVILFRSYYGSYVSGLLVDYEIRRRYESTQKRISVLETAVGSGSTMPQYWLTYMQTKIADVQDKDVLVGQHGDSFVFITDIHYEFNDKNSPPIVKYVLNNSSVNRVVCGGDVISGGGTNTKATALTSLANARNSFRNIGVNPLYLRGNHDNNTEISPAKPEIAISDSELYGILWKPIENEITMGSELNYYFDNETQKIRYICLDTGHPDTNVMSDAQITWMQNLITELDSSWSVLVLTHQFYSTPPTKDGNGTKIEAGLDAIYDSANATIIGVVCGHSHRDYIGTSAKGYPIICTTCDIRAGEGGGLTRTKNTTTEQAFDVFHVDFTNRMIYATRIGAGSDRSVGY